MIQSKLVDIHGKIHCHNTQDDDYEQAKWLQHNILAQALPNGICALPAQQQRCPHANACLTCVNFRTHEKFLTAHHAQLEATEQLLKTAQANGWQRQIEMNFRVKSSLETIIKRLEAK